jgi:hypothetical protein
MRTLLLLLILTPFATAADPSPSVKVELSPKEGVWVGQRVTLTIKLSTPGLFANAPSFNMPAIPGAVVLPPTGSPVLGSERVGDTVLTTQLHEFAESARPDQPNRRPVLSHFLEAADLSDQS